MDPAPINPQPLIALPHGGHETLEQRPTDGHLPVGATCLDQQPPSKFHHPVNPPQPPLTALSNGAPVFPVQQPKCRTTSAGLGHSGQQSPFASYHPGGFAFAGQQLPSIDEILLDCAKLINQLLEQQQHLRSLCTAYQSAMAAPPSSTSSQLEQHFEVRTSSRPDQAPSSPTESCEALQDVPLMARSSTGSAHGVHQEGGRTSAIQEGRKCNNSARKVRHSCEAGPPEVQDWPTDSVGSGTPNVNGKQSGSQASPAAVSAQALTGGNQRLPVESARDVSISSADYQKIVLASEGPVQHPGSDDVNDDGHRCIADSQSSAAQWITVSVVNQIDQHKLFLVSYVINAVDLQLAWWKPMSSVIPVDRLECLSPAVVARMLFERIYGGCPTSHSLISYEPQHTPSQAKCVDIADDCSQPFNNHEGRWLEPGEVEAFVNLPPPWPPPATIIVALQNDARSKPEFNMQFSSRNIFSVVDFGYLLRVFVDDQCRSCALRICSLFYSVKSAFWSIPD